MPNISEQMLVKMATGCWFVHHCAQCEFKKECEKLFEFTIDKYLCMVPKLKKHEVKLGLAIPECDKK